ncbi:MAG TPA: oxidoreductase [Edaphobacter sp.]|nr:oxidoreductase [Edaphobacter sp.]
MSERDAVVRVGLVGYGYAGKTFHAPLIGAVPGLQLAVMGSSRREAVQAAYPGVAVCDAMAAATHAEVDLVVIASPNESHFPLAAAALAAGKHVVIDKPFTVTLAEARSLVETAQKHQRILSVFHNRCWDSEVLATKEILESGVLGDVSHYECHMDRFRPLVRQRWREEPGPGAGLWFDLGPHLIDQALYLFGLPDSVNASFATLREGGQTDDWAHVQLNYKRLRVVLHASLLASGGAPRSLLHGTRGSWAKFGADVQERQLQSGMLPGDPAFGYDASPGIVYDGATGTQREVPSPRGDQTAFYAVMRDAVRGQAPPPVSMRDAVAVMAVLEASFASAAQGRVLPIALTAEEQAEWGYASLQPR